MEEKHVVTVRILQSSIEASDMVRNVYAVTRSSQIDLFYRLIQKYGWLKLQEMSLKKGD